MTRPQRAYAALVVVAIALMALVHSWGYGPLYVLLVALGAAVVIVFVPRWIIGLGEQARNGLNHQVWKAHEGHHHAFAGVIFTMADDGRHMWMQGDALKRVLARPEADDVLAARISGKWKLDESTPWWSTCPPFPAAWTRACRSCGAGSSATCCSRPIGGMKADEGR
jgi:hypothetical protein